MEKTDTETKPEPTVEELKERVASIEKRFGLDQKPPTKDEAIRQRKRH